MKLNIIRITFLFFFSFLAGILPAQQVNVFPNIQYFTSDDGLSQNEITCIVQDRKGFLWIGTRGGLNRYDGTNFKIFQNEIGNTNSLVNNSVESLFEDSKGNIWIGTKSNGLSKYNPELDLFEHFQHNALDSITIGGNRIIALSEGQRGDIWAGSWDNGVTIIHSDNQIYQHLLPETRIRSMCLSSDSTMWLAGSDGFVCLHSRGPPSRSIPSRTR